MKYSPISQPEDIPKRFAEAWNHRDPDALAAIFDEDAEFVNVVGLWWHSRKDIRKAHAYGLSTIFNDSVLEIRRIKVKFLSENIAVVHAKMSLQGQTPIQGMKPSRRNTLFSFVVHEKGAEWKCASAHNTEIIPGKETFVMDEEGRASAVDYRVKKT